MPNDYYHVSHAFLKQLCSISSRMRKTIVISHPRSMRLAAKYSNNITVHTPNRHNGKNTDPTHYTKLPKAYIHNYLRITT